MFFVLPIGDIAPRRRTPYVNYAVMAVNIAVFLLVGFRADYQSIVEQYGVVPARPEWLAFFSSMFLHGGLIHLGGNMLFLWIVGDNVEDVLGHIGYLAFYLLGGVLAHLPQLMLFAKSPIPGIGASGAISAVMAAYTVWFARNRIKVWYAIWLFPFIRSGVALVPAVFAIGLWFLAQFLYGLATLGHPFRGGVGYWVHVGGFVFGLVVAGVVRLLWPGRIPQARRADVSQGRRYFRVRRPPRHDQWGGGW